MIVVHLEILLVPFQTYGKRWNLTHSRNNLSFETVLVLEPASPVVDSSMTITNNVGHFSDVIEHMSAGEKKNCDQADGGPYIAVLNHREQIRPSNSSKGERTQYRCSDRNDADPVDWSADGRMWFTGQFACNPLLYLFCSLRSARY